MPRHSQLAESMSVPIQPLAIKRIQQFGLPIVHLFKYPLSFILINFAGNEEMAAKAKWIRIFSLCGTITVQTKYHRCQLPRLEVMYFCRCYWYFHLAGSLFWPPPTQSRPIAFPCYQLGMWVYSRALSSWPLNLSFRQSSDRRRFTMLLLRCTLLDPPLPSIPCRVSHDTARRSGINKLSLLAPPQPAGPPWWWFSQQPKRDRSATWWRGKILFRPTVHCSLSIYRVAQ